MTDHAEHSAHGAHSEGHYIRIWAILLVLLLISFAGPYLGIRVVTLITAFGIAVYKAYLVAKHFMHVNVQPRFVAYLLSTCLVFMLLFYAGAAPDVMEHEGANWVKPNPQAGQPHRIEHPESAEAH